MPQVDELSVDLDRRLKRVEEKLGRPLRVLHIGNIANNAYNNAKIMRRYGIEADVLSLNSYHVTSTPEWEEGAIVALAGTPQAPDWRLTKLRDGYRRPNWFIEGPGRLCIPYLHARKHNRFAAAVLGALLGMHNSVHSAQKGWRHALAALLPLARAAARWATSRSKPDASASPAETTQASRATADETGMQPGDLDEYQLEARLMERLGGYYDIIQGYALSAIIPQMSGYGDKTTCYEHGTLRDIPFEDTPRGRVCAHTYRQAPAVFITNTDCVAAADRLGIPRRRQHPIPHAFNDLKLSDYCAKRAPQISRPSVPTFIAPARHDWRGDVSKGNDIVLHAVERLSAEKRDFRLRLVRWGEDIAASEQLIRELGIGRHIEWLDLMPKEELWDQYLTCDGILDQFVLPALSGIGFEALACGKPLFTRIDPNVVKPFFGAEPPLLNVDTPDTLAAAMSILIQDRSAYNDISIAAAEWARVYHSSARVMSLQLDVYEHMIKGLQTHNLRIPEA